MKLSSIMKHAALGVPMAVLAFGMATNANAQSLEAGKCYPKATAEALLKKDGQAPVAIGSEVNGTGNAHVYFSNNARTLGYDISGDQPLGTPSKELCVSTTYKDIRFNSPTNPDIPTWLTVKKATGGYSDFNKAYENGGRIVMTARAFERQSNGTEKLGQTIAIVALPDKTASVQGINSEGYASGFYALKNFALTANAGPMQAAIRPQEPVAIAANTVLPVQQLK